MATRKKNKNTNFIGMIKDYWNGKYSLAGSFWFGFLILGTIITGPSVYFSDSLIDGLGTLGLIGLMVYFAIMYPYIILMYVGTWRSASNYKPKKGQWAWGTIAKVYIALNALRGIVQIIREFTI